MSKRSFMGGFGRSGSGRGGNPFSRGKKQTSTPETPPREKQAPSAEDREPPQPVEEPSSAFDEPFFNFAEENIAEGFGDIPEGFGQLPEEEQFAFFDQDPAENETQQGTVNRGGAERSLTEQFLSVGAQVPPLEDAEWGGERASAINQTNNEPEYETVLPEYGIQKSAEEARVFLRYSEEAPKGNPILARLIALFRLDVYGKNKLSKRALYAMEMASVIMVVIFCFDLSLWFVLFNLILNKGGEAFAIGMLTPFAILLAICMATVSIIFEASIFTADLSKMDVKKWIALGARIGLVMIAARITAAPFHVLIFHGPIAERTRIEQGIEKGIFIAGELQDSQSNLEKAICSNEGQAGIVEEDQQDIEDKSKLVSSSIEDLEKQIEDLKYKPYKDKNRNFTRPLDEKKGSKVWTLKESLNWAKGVSCINDYMDEDKAYGGMTRSQARQKCAKLASVRQERINFLNKKIKTVEEALQKKKKEAAGLAVDEQEVDETRTELAKLNDDCKKEVGKMENWYADGLKGYSRKLTSTSTESSVFTLTNCYNTNDVLKSCGSYRDGLKETSLEQKVSEYLDEKLKIQLAKLEAAKQSQLATNPANSESLEKAFETQEKAITALNDKKKQICSEWCFEYKPPNITKQILALDHMRFGEAPKWPEYQNYSLKDCQIMIDVLRIPVPDDGRCSAYAPDVDLVEAKAKGEFVNAVTIVNKDSSEGVVNTVGDKLECSVRLKQGKKDTLYEIRWVINGAPKGNMGIFSKKTRATAILDTSKGLYKGDLVSCQVTPLNSQGEIAKAVKSSTITMNKGPARPQVKTESADAKTLDEQYFLVMAIGMFIPLVSLLFKMVAPKDLKDYYSVEHQGKDSSKTIKKIMTPAASNDDDDWDGWDDDWSGLADDDYQGLYEGMHPDEEIAQARETRKRRKRQREQAASPRNPMTQNKEQRTARTTESRQQGQRGEGGGRTRRGSARKNNSRMR